MEEILKEKQEQQKMVYEIIAVLAKKNLSIKQCKRILNAVEEELENLIPWNQSSSINL
jgi:uncharacterized coiled-coil protein SlyX